MLSFFSPPKGELIHKLNYIYIGYHFIFVLIGSHNFRVIILVLRKLLKKKGGDFFRVCLVDRN